MGIEPLIQPPKASLVDVADDGNITAEGKIREARAWFMEGIACDVFLLLISNFFFFFEGTGVIFAFPKHSQLGSAIKYLEIRKSLPSY